MELTLDGARAGWSSRWTELALDKTRAARLEHERIVISIARILFREMSDNMETARVPAATKTASITIYYVNQRKRDLTARAGFMAFLKTPLV